MKKGLRITAWIVAGLVLLIFFTLIKFPQDRLKPLIQSQIGAALAAQGITLVPERSHLGFLFGLSYTLENVKISSPSLPNPVTIERIRVAPALIGSIMGQVQARIAVTQGSGSATIDLFMPHPEESAEFEVDAQFRAFDLGAVPLVQLFTGVQAGGILSGQLAVEGNAEIPSSLEGTADLKIQKFQLDQQSFMGLPLPKIGAPQAQIRLNASKGKFQVEQVQIEKGGELWASLTGQSTLGQRWDASTLELKTQFGLTESVLKALPLVDTLLGGARQADGTYAFTITGTWAAPFFNPVGAQ